MKKLAIIGSGTSRVLKAILEHLSEVEITCISNDLNSEIFKYATYTEINTKFLTEKEISQYFSVSDFDLIALTDYNGNLNDALTTGKFINIHPSLLPAFNGKDAIYRAYEAGVKVSGVTVHYLSEDATKCKIIAQYPVLIGNLTHFDEYQEEIYKLEEKIYPIVIDKLLKDQVFDFSDLFANNSCSGCSNCCH